MEHTELSSLKLKDDDEKNISSEKFSQPNLRNSDISSEIETEEAKIPTKVKDAPK